MNGEPLIILLVEDNVHHAELVMRGLQDHKVANIIYHVKDGEEAIDYLFRRKNYADTSTCPVPHLILLDLRLPKLDGFDVLEKIKTDNELRKIPVVVLTSSNAEKDLNKAYDHYVNSYLVKPVDFEKFQKLMQDLGFYWLVWNQKPIE
jgi:two-component system, response regulator